ncbi:hypothetical protein MFLAVUS_010384 [Mucor flavus]|uniref:Uncharacterized protein n=1 Tax=Mucor flavus TaxID=439312 RepID=A0ABP9ZCK5_9FUNG
MSDANNNHTATSNLDIAPAQIVGGMRVKQPDAHRTPLKAETKDVKEGDEEQTAEEDEDEERARQRALQERQAQDMQAHTASRQPDISKNAGSNVKQQFIPSTQPRSMNH